MKSFAGALNRHGTALSIAWFTFMVGMWVLFFAGLLGGRLDGVWSTVRDLPLIVQLALWLPFLPWMLGMLVWATSWFVGLRVLLVLVFAVGWTLVSIPHKRGAREASIAAFSTGEEGSWTRRPA